MSPRIRKFLLLGLSLSALAVGAVAAIAQSREALPPVPLTPPDGVPLGAAVPSAEPGTLPIPSDLPPLPFLVDAPGSAVPPSPPGSTPHPDTSAPPPPMPRLPLPAATPPPSAPAAPRSAAVTVPEPGDTKPFAPPPASLPSSAGGAPAAALVGDPELARQIEKWQRDQLLYSFALRAIQQKDQLCELKQAPMEICGPRRRPVIEDEPRPVYSPPPRFVEPAPMPDRGPPYRVLSVAGSGTDVVVTLQHNDLQATHTVRPGAWIDGDFKVLAADFQTVTLQGRGKTHRLPVSNGASWGSRS